MKSQPIERDDKGTLRFRSNGIVKFLLGVGPFDMNNLALMTFSDRDRRQFAQLIGYSVNGYCELSYVRDKDAEKAMRQAEKVDAE